MEIWLTIAISYVSSKDTDKGYVMHSKSDNIKIVIYDKTNKVFE